MSSIAGQVWESDWRLFTKICQDTIDLLGTAHTRMKAFGGKTTVKTSATSDVCRLIKSLKKKKKDEQLFNGSAVLWQEVCRWKYRCVEKHT